MGSFLSHVASSLEAHDCRVIVLSAKELADAQQNDVFLKLLRRFRVPWLLIYWVHAFRVWRRAGYPLIVPISQEWVVPFGFSKQIPIYHDVIQYFFPRNRKSALYYRYYLRWVTRRLPLVYCVTDSTGRMVRRILGCVGYRVCGVPIDKEFLSPVDEKIAGERFRSVWVGTLATHKNYARVLDYMQSSADREANAAMVVSIAEAQVLDQEIKARGLANRIRIFSRLSERELSSLYRRSETVLSTSWLEGFCMPVLEAALCGAVPVVPDRATFRENFSRFGVLVPPHSADYAGYIKIAADKFDRHTVMRSAQAFHQAVHQRWLASMSDISNAVMLGRVNGVVRRR